MEKMNISISSDLYKVLCSDALSFKICKNDGSVNMNKFITNIIVGHKDGFIKERNDFVNYSINIFEKYFPQNNSFISNQIANEIYEKSASFIQSSKSNNVVNLSYKPTKQTETIILEFANEMKDLPYCGLKAILESYSRKPMHIREQIIFSNNYNVINECIKTSKSLTMFHGLEEREHVIIPYAFAIGVEEMFNYLLCAEISNGKQIATTYRLSNINKFFIGKILQIDNTIKEVLDNSKKINPAYITSKSEPFIVKFSEQGLADYKRRYNGRPKEISQEIIDGYTYITFNCSSTQAFRYFIRFGEDATIIQPESLRKQIKNFYKKAFESYKNED